MKKHLLFPMAMLSALVLGACAIPTPAPSSSSSEEAPASSEEAPASSETSASSESSAVSSASSEEGPTQLITEPTTVTIWSTFNSDYQTILDNAANEVMRAEPNLTIEIIKQNTGYDGLHSMVQEKVADRSYPDMTVAYPDSVADYIDANIAKDMTPYMNNPVYGWSEEDFEDIPSAYLDEGRNYTIPGTFSLPLAKSTEALYYNQDILLGLDLHSIDPTINEGKPINEDYMDSLTWEELFDKLCPALLKYDSDVEELITKTGDYSEKWSVCGYDSDANLFITLANQYGYGYTAVDSITGEGRLEFVNDGMKDLMKTLNNAYSKHYLATQGTLGAYTSKAFNVDSMLMSIGSTGGVSNQFSSSNPHNIGVAHIPHAANGRRSVIQQGPSFSFLKHEDNPNRTLGAWLFYKTFSTAKYAAAWSLATGYMPLRYSVAESRDYIAYADASDKQDATKDRLLALNAGYSVQAVSDFYASPVFKGSSAARTYVGSLLTDCLNETSLDSKIDSLFDTAYNAVLLKM